MANTGFLPALYINLIGLCFVVLPIILSYLVYNFYAGSFKVLDKRSTILHSANFKKRKSCFAELFYLLYLIPLRYHRCPMNTVNVSNISVVMDR